MANEVKRAYMREYMRKYRAENAEKIKARHKAWRDANPDKVREYQEKYWAKRLAEVQATETEASKVAIKSGE